MKENFWIYISCLLFCAAIGHRVWEYEVQMSSIEKFSKLTDKYERDLRKQYENKRYALIEQSRKKRSVYNSYKDSLAVLKYIVTNDKISDLIDLSDEFKSIDISLEGLKYLPDHLHKYIYACKIVDGYLSRFEYRTSLESIKVVSNVLDISKLNDGFVGIKFELFSFNNKEDEIYEIDDVVVSSIKGVVASKSIPKKLKVTVMDKVTFEKKTYKYHDLKVN